MLGSDNPPGDGELNIAADVGGALAGGATHLTLRLEIVNSVKQVKKLICKTILRTLQTFICCILGSIGECRIKYKHSPER